MRRGGGTGGRVCILASHRVSEQVGGVESFLKTFCKWLESRGVPFLLVHRRLAPFPVSARPSLGPGTKGPGSSRAMPLPEPVGSLYMLCFSALSALACLRSHKRRRILLVHSQDLTYAGLAAVLVARAARVPAVVQAHALPPALRGAGGVAGAVDQALTKFVVAAADRVIVADACTGGYIRSLGVPDAKISRIGLGVDLGAFREDQEARRDLRSKLGIGGSDIAFGYVGGFRPEKNLLGLLEAYSGLVKARGQRGTRLVLVGAGPEEEKLRRAVAREGLGGNVVFAGSAGDVARIMQALDVVVIPSFYETFSLALVEAMASGKAIIASAIPAVQEKVVHGESALLVDPHDPGEIAEAMLLLASDGGLRRRISENAKAASVRYGFRGTFEAICSVYRELGVEPAQ